MTTRTPLAAYLQPPLPEARLDAQWADIGRRRAAHRSGQRVKRWSAATGAALGLGVALWVVLSPRAPDLAGTVFEGGESSVSIALPDGSHVTLSAHGSLRVQRAEPDTVALDLLNGSARFEVPHVEPRSFVVTTARALVVVVGTIFEVDAGPLGLESTLRVTVDVGAVEVRSRASGELLERVAAGRAFSMGPDAAPVGGAGDSASAAAPSEPAALATARGSHKPVQAPATAEAMFAAANEARRADRIAEAVAAYELLLRTHPGDARARLGAFELGRIRMDVLGDLEGAGAAFAQALAARGDASFREDATARLVRALDGLGQRERCRAVRGEYLERYQAGLHAVAVRAACGGR